MDVGIGSDRPVPRLSNMISRPNEARRSRSSASGGTSHCASRLPNHWSSRRMSGGPSPTTWYARWRSPKRAYRVSGTIVRSLCPADKPLGPGSGIRPLNAGRAMQRFAAPTDPGSGAGPTRWNAGRSAWRFIARFERPASSLLLPGGRNRRMERVAFRRRVPERGRCDGRRPGGRQPRAVGRIPSDRAVVPGRGMPGSWSACSRRIRSSPMIVVPRAAGSMGHSSGRCWCRVHGPTLPRGARCVQHLSAVD